MIMYNRLEKFTDFEKYKNRVNNDQLVTKNAINKIWCDAMHIELGKKQVSYLKNLARKLGALSLFPDDAYDKAKRATTSLEKDLLAAKAEFDRGFEEWNKKMAEDGRTTFPEKMPEAMFEEFKRACETARKSYMPSIEASHSKLEDIYALWTWLKSCVWDDVDVYKTTEEVSDGFKKEYERIIPKEDNVDATEHTPLNKRRTR